MGIKGEITCNGPQRNGRDKIMISHLRDGVFADNPRNNQD
jgi:hypothetical protein